MSGSYIIAAGKKESENESESEEWERLLALSWGGIRSVTKRVRVK